MVLSAINKVITMGVLLDTGFLYSLKDKDDARNKTSLQILKDFQWESKGPAFTTSTIINETYTLLNARSKGNVSLLSKLDELFFGDERFFMIHCLKEHELKETSALLKKFTSPNKILSFADASLIFLGILKKCTFIISYDEHFDGIFTRTFDT